MGADLTKGAALALALWLFATFGQGVGRWLIISLVGMLIIGKRYSSQN